MASMGRVATRPLDVHLSNYTELELPPTNAVEGNLFKAYLVGYAGVRFGMDFLRIIDTRYLGLTPAQYGCIAFTFIGAAILWWRSPRSGDANTEPERSAT